MNYSKEINSDQDVLDSRIPLYLPVQGALLAWYQTSPLQVQRSLWNRLKENRDWQYSLDETGLLPLDIQKKMITEGMIFT